MTLAQLDINSAEPLDIVTTDPNYEFIQNTLRPSYFVGTAINLLLGFSGVAAFIYLLWGGLQWITAGGDKDAVEKARKKILGALIGLSIVFSAYAILHILRILFNIELIGWNITQLGS